jgi:hypothetical protein
MQYEMYLDRNKLIELLPYAISYLETFEKVNGINLEIYTDDSKECYIHLRVISNDLIVYSINSEYVQEIHKHLEKHCCKCGSQENVTQYYFDCNFCAWGGIVLCEECAAKEKGLLEYLLYQIKNQSKTNTYKANHIKVKLRTEDNHIIYRFAEEILYEDGNFIIKNSLNPQNKEFVKIIGQSIGLRDVYGERVYEGDILLAEDDKGIRFWGMVKVGKSGWDISNSPSPQWDNYMLCHGWGNFPSSLAFATKFKIIGSIGTIKNYDENIHIEHCYQAWILENKDIDMYKVLL